MGLDAKWEELYTIGAWTEWLEVVKQWDLNEYEYWTDPEGCDECAHFQRLFTWCSFVNRPATINSFLKMQGMACGGIGWCSNGEA